jgi:hypothetical protein
VDEEHIPTLIQLIYGERAALGAKGASARLKRWCAATGGGFDTRLN